MTQGIHDQFDQAEAKIFNRFPKLFRQATLPPERSCMYWGIETPYHWFPVIEKLAEDINEIAEDCVEFSQIKEKWSELRVYVDYLEGATVKIIEKVNSLIDEAESKIHEQEKEIRSNINIENGKETN
jgi:phosphomannomutase